MIVSVHGGEPVFMKEAILLILLREIAGHQILYKQRCIMPSDMIITGKWKHDI